MVYGIGGIRPWEDPRDPRRAVGPRPISGFDGQFSGLTPQEAVVLPRMPQVVAPPPGDLVGTTAMPAPLVVRGPEVAAVVPEAVQLSIPGDPVTLAQTGRPMDWLTRASLSSARFPSGPEETVLASSVRPGFNDAPVPAAPGQIPLLVQAGTAPAAPIDIRAVRVQALAQELGLPERTAAWLIDQDAQGLKEIRQAMGARNDRFARALEQRGTIPSARDVAGAPIGAIIAQSGEVRQDPLGRALRSLNARLTSTDGGTFFDEAGYQRDLGSGAIVDRGVASPTERPIDAASLSVAELAALAPGDLSAARAARLPYAATGLSPAETQAVFQDSGASRTRGGSRNPFDKEPSAGFTENPRDLYPGTFTLRDRSSVAADPDNRYAWFTPGTVMGSRVEPNPATASIPLLIAPRSQERNDILGAFQAPNTYIKSQGGFVQGLSDARIMDVNPLAQLSPAVADALSARLGYSFYSPVEPDQYIVGGRAGRSTNAPIPDPSIGGGGFEPAQDPAAIATRAVGGVRPMTVAEAVSEIARRNLAPISPVMVDQLVGDGQVVVRDPVVHAGVGARRPAMPGSPRMVDVNPLGRLTEQEKRESSATVLRRRAGDQGFVDARIGSRGRYGPGLYGDVDALIGALAAEAFPDARAGFQVLNTASDVATRNPVQSAVRDPFNPVVIERPVGDQWSLLVNTPTRDPLVSNYQNELLRRAGIGVTESGNPLLSLVGDIQSLAGVPVPNTPIPPAAPAAQRVVPGSSDPENALRLAKIQARRGAGDRLAQIAANPQSFASRDYEANARAVLSGVLRGNLPLSARR